MLATCTFVFGQSPFGQNLSSQDAPVKKSIIGYEICDKLQNQVEVSFTMEKWIPEHFAGALTASQKGSIIYQMRMDGYDCVDGKFENYTVVDCPIQMKGISLISYEKDGVRKLAIFSRNSTDKGVSVLYCNYKE